MRNLFALVAVALTALVSIAGDHTRVRVNTGNLVGRGHQAQPVFLNLNSGYSHNSNALRLNLSSGYSYNSVQALSLSSYAAPVVSQPLVLNLAQPQCTPAQNIFLNLQSGYNTRSLTSGCGKKGTAVVPAVPGIIP